MKKIMILVLLVLLALIAAYLVFNQIDARANQSKLSVPPVWLPRHLKKRTAITAYGL